ncbi:MAG: enoyl-CoA hydratase/isomerase family protein [Proteobacteria bacterium]|nr:enoyl-CoA hydratase/isomerase family protein [Pseudomonadota bacterium]
MEYSFIRLERQGPVAVLTLNRPDCLNAVHFPMQNELEDALKSLVLDFDTRVLVITGAGRGFCSGLDIRDPKVLGPPEGRNPEESYRLQRTYSDLILLLRAIPQPVIAAVNGPAAGAGFSFALASDIRLASPTARFSAAFINIGVGGADLGSSWLFPRIVGMGNAARHLYTGDVFSADEALRIGLVQEIVAGEELMNQAMTMAQVMASKSPLGLRVTKEALNANLGGCTLEQAVRLEDRNQALCIAGMTHPAGRG